MKVCSYCGRGNDRALTMCAECGTQLSEGEVQPVVGRPKPFVNCPACGSPDDYKPALKLRGSFSWLTYLTGGFLAVLFQNASRTKRFQCNKCATFFSIGTPLTKLSRIMFWLLVGPTVIALVAFLIAVLISFFSH
jgi:hypothetical protein